jgi:hypothetical protein
MKKQNVLLVHKLTREGQHVSLLELDTVDQMRQERTEQGRDRQVHSHTVQ